MLKKSQQSLEVTQKVTYIEVNTHPHHIPPYIYVPYERLHLHDLVHFIFSCKCLAVSIKKLSTLQAGQRNILHHVFPYNCNLLLAHWLQYWNIFLKSLDNIPSLYNLYNEAAPLQYTACDTNVMLISHFSSGG